jgi:hypothetical protein
VARAVLSPSASSVVSTADVSAAEASAAAMPVLPALLPPPLPPPQADSTAADNRARLIETGGREGRWRSVRIWVISILADKIIRSPVRGPARFQCGERETDEVSTTQNAWETLNTAARWSARQTSRGDVHRCFSTCLRHLFCLPRHVVCKQKSHFVTSCVNVVLATCGAQVSESSSCRIRTTLNLGGGGRLAAPSAEFGRIELRGLTTPTRQVRHRPQIEAKVTT